MLTRHQEGLVRKTALQAATPELALDNAEVFDVRHARIREQLVRASNPADLSWFSWHEGYIAPSPEVSLAFLEQLTNLSKAMARIGIRATVDENIGCWSLPLAAEYDSKKRARYPTIYDTENKRQGVLAHRYVWRTLINPGITSDEHLDHLCRTHACCNPTHLEVVTVGTNTKRGNLARQIIGGQEMLFQQEP